MGVMVKEQWRLIDTEFEDSCMNLAIDEAIPTVLGMGYTNSTVRFWRNVNTVVIGRSQDIVSEVNLAACNKYGTLVIRRFTGGGTVYHDLGNLNYSISLRKDHYLISDDLVRTVEVLSKGVMLGLKNLGIKAEYRLSDGIFISGKKVSGSASSVKQSFFFNHGTLLINSNLAILSEVLSPTLKRRKKRGVKSSHQIVTNLAIELGREISISEVKEALKLGFERAFQIELVRGELTSEEILMAQKFLEKKIF
ncbi:lipoate--protein ligase family protein [Candidatus Bathyarchaeota archaeon]|nr:lipoate--protein ligase family protein [Candidatus Bathyarchaeota archaeon]